MKRLLLALALALSVTAHAQTKISALPAASTPLGGTEIVPCVQSATTAKCQVSDIFTAGGDLSGTNVVQTIVAGQVSNSKLATVPAYSVKGNNSASTAAPSDISALVVNEMIGTTMAVEAVGTANIATLSGTQTVDGVSVGNGQIVLLTNETSVSCDGGTHTNGQCNGPWVTASGAWTRPPYYPNGGAITAYCEFGFSILQGTTYKGYMAKLNTTAAVTIGTTATTWQIVTIPRATSTVQGTVKTTTTNSALPVVSLGAPNPAVLDCASFADTAGSISSTGYGACMYADAAGHLEFGTGTGVAPTANHGAVDANSYDNRGFVTGVAATTTSLTLTFNAAFPTTPSCMASSNAATPFAASVTAVSTAAVTFTFPALAGSTTIYYICL